jgi:hypothetical protein
MKKETLLVIAMSCAIARGSVEGGWWNLIAWLWFGYMIGAGFGLWRWRIRFIPDEPSRDERGGEGGGGE